MQHVSRSGRPYPNIVHNVQSPALKQTIRPQEWLCHSRLRMVQSLQITGVKRNVLFLQRARMQKLINGSMRNVSLSGERGGPSAPGGWWKVESTMLECRKACCCSGIIVTRRSSFLPLSSFNTDLDTKYPLLAKGKHAKAD